MAVVAPAPVIAAAAAARRRVRHAFSETGAYSPEAAIPYEPHRHLERRYFEGLRDSGAVVEPKPGLFYVDEAKLAEHDRKRRKLAFTLIGGALAAGLALFGFSQL